MEVDVDDPSLQGVVDESQGNPRLIDELCRLPRSNPGQATPSRKAILDASMAALSTEQRLLLATVAAAGQPTPQGALVAAAGVQSAPHSTVGALRAAGLVQTFGPRPQDLMVTYDGRVGAHVLAASSKETRVQVHAALADELAKRGVEPGRLARHSYEAGRESAAAELSEQAGDQAGQTMAFEVAAEHYANALAWGRPAESLERSLRTRRGRALVDAGRPGTAAPELRAAAEMSDGESRLQLRTMAIDAALSAGLVEDGLRDLVPELKRLGLHYPTTAVRAAASLSVNLLRVRWAGLKPSRGAKEPNAQTLAAIDLCWATAKSLNNILPIHSLYFAAEGVLRSRQVGRPFRASRALAMLGGNLSMAGGPVAKLGERCLARAYQLAEEIDSDYLRGLHLLMTAIKDYAVDAGWRTAVDKVERGMALMRTEQHGLRWESTLASAVGLTSLEMLGSMRAYRAQLVELRREADECGDHYLLTVAGQCEVIHAIARGELGRARRIDRRLVEQWFSAEMTVQRAVSTQLNLRMLLYEGRAADAQALLEEQLRSLKSAGMFRIAFARIAIVSMMGIIAATEMVSAQSTDKGLRAVARAAKTLEKESRVDGQIQGAMLRAVLEAFRGNTKEASKRLDACAEAFEQQEMALHALACRRRARELVGDDVGSVDAAIEQLGVREPGAYVRTLVPTVISE